MLTFSHASFDIADIKNMSVEYVKDDFTLTNFGFIRKVSNDYGARFFFLIDLIDGRCFQITPDSVIEPTGNTNLYFRDKDFSWGTLVSMATVLEDKYCRWYDSDEVKQLSRQLGYPVQQRINAPA